MEQWRTILGFDGYEVSDLGRVRSWRRFGALHPLPTEPHILKGTITKRGVGYLQVSLYRGDGRSASLRVSRLVAIAFLGHQPSPAHEVAHWDGDRMNNRVGNLRWATAAENAADRERHGNTARGSRSGVAKLNEATAGDIRRRFAGGEKKRAIARIFNVDRRTIDFVVRGLTWKITHMESEQ